MSTDSKFNRSLSLTLSWISVSILIIFLANSVFDWLLPMLLFFKIDARPISGVCPLLSLDAAVSFRASSSLARAFFSLSAVSFAWSTALCARPTTNAYSTLKQHQYQEWCYFDNNRLELSRIDPIWKSTLSIIIFPAKCNVHISLYGFIPRTNFPSIIASSVWFGSQTTIRSHFFAGASSFSPFSSTRIVNYGKYEFGV